MARDPDTWQRREAGRLGGHFAELIFRPERRDGTSHGGQSLFGVARCAGVRVGATHHGRDRPGWAAEDLRNPFGPRYRLARTRRVSQKKDGRLWLKDRDSRNRSFVNDKQVKESPLVLGDLVRLGSVVLEVVDEATVMQATAVLEHRPTSSIALGDASRLAYESTIARLSETQVRVLRLLLTGKAEKEMAAKLFVSPHTVHSHVQAVYRELGASSRAELMALFIDRAVMEPHD